MKKPSQPMSLLRTIAKLSSFGFLIFGLYGLIDQTFSQELKDTQHMHAMHERSNGCESKELECANAATPALLRDGSLLLTWTAGGAVSVARSRDGGRTFGARIQIADHQKFLDTGGDARPQIVADDLGHVMVAYGYFKDSHWNAKINFAVSKDFGEHFSTPRPLIQQGESERFPVLALDAKNTVHVAWIDKRVVAQKNRGGQPALGASVAYTNTSNWGASFKMETIVNAETCECCRIGMGIDLQDRAALAYRAIFSGGVRDHAFQWVGNGEKPSSIMRIANDNWVTDVCPHQGPSVSVSNSGVVHTTWFTLGERRHGLFYARSENGGITLSEPVKIGRDEFNPSRAFTLASGRNVWLVWKEFDGIQSKVFMRKSTDDGLSWSDSFEVSKTQGYSDHPLLVQRQNQVYLSWYTRADGYQLISLGE